MPRRLLLATCLAWTTIACAAHPAPQAAPAARERELTLGLVQREVQEGDLEADVLEALGSPNLVTVDADGHEVWVYDRVATERTVSADGGALGGVVSGTAGTGGGVVAGYGSRERRHESTSQKTLTVVIRMGKDSRVASVRVHATRF